MLAFWKAEGLEAANINAIAARAGVSVGSLYQYFPDKAAIFAELIRQAETGLGDMLGKLLAETAGQSLEDCLKPLVKAGVAQQMARPQLGRILDNLEATFPADAYLKAAEERILRLIMQLLNEHEEGIARPVTPATALDVLSIVKGIVDGASFAGETNAAALERRVMFAVLGYLKQP
ncbi:MAG: TetR/AcrR family transcriptional regulator [Alphaproteobacteria bacterium]|nr:TetR/AcrR family transcriptional regulator [Alphaproteobacteria bacterium]